MPELLAGIKFLLTIPLCCCNFKTVNLRHALQKHSKPFAFNTGTPNLNDWSIFNQQATAGFFSSKD